MQPYVEEAFWRTEDIRSGGDGISDSTEQIKGADIRKNAFAACSNALPISEDMIFYESMSGAKMMDSPFAIFDTLQRQHPKDFGRYTHIWSVGSEEKIPASYRNIRNVKFVRRHTVAYVRSLATAKYVIGNSTLPEYFVRRDGQKYLNTWHGIGYKTLGRSLDNPLGAALSVTNMLQATHVLSPCDFMTKTFMYRFSMRGAFTGEMAECGYPRIDITVNLTRERRAHLEKVLGLDPQRKTVLYAPTWRGGDKGNTFDTPRLERDLKALSQQNINTVFLAHHMMLKHIAEVDLEGVIVPPEDANTNELLAVSDLLITDYSSIFFDFLSTRKPIIHYLYDYEDYAKRRGLTLSLKELPGEVVFDSATLIRRVQKHVLKNRRITRRYRKSCERFAPHDHGSSSNSVIKWFFHEDRSSVRLVKTDNSFGRIIFWGGRLDDSEASLHFLKEVEAEANAGRKNVTLFVARSVKKHPMALQKIRNLGDSVSIVARNDYDMAQTPEEERSRATIKSKPNREDKDRYRAIYSREYRRIFGDSKFDEVRVYPRASHFWKELSKFARR